MMNPKQAAALTADVIRSATKGDDVGIPVAATLTAAVVVSPVVFIGAMLFGKKG